MNKYKIAIVDDHSLFAESLESLINNFDNFEVKQTLKNGQELIDVLENDDEIPDVILLDINMPVMNGFQTMEWIKANKPNLKVLALSMDDEEQTIIKMLSHGAKGYLLKDMHPKELSEALNKVIEYGYYYTDLVNQSLINSINQKESDSLNNDNTIALNNREFTFLELACTEKTYKEIAEDMCVSPKTVDGYRDTLFRKFGVSNRIGLVLFAFKNKLVNL